MLERQVKSVMCVFSQHSQMGSITWPLPLTIQNYNICLYINTWETWSKKHMVLWRIERKTNIHSKNGPGKIFLSAKLFHNSRTKIAKETQFVPASL